MPRSDDWTRHNAATRRLYRDDKTYNQPFRGVDGEGGNVDEPGKLFGKRHEYLGLRAGEHFLDSRTLGRPLNHDDCFTFLTSLPKNRINVGYFFDYDVTMMIKSLPEERARRLINRHLRVAKNGDVYPVDYNGWQFDYMPHKEFKVRDLSHGTRPPFTVINDTGTFFQARFTKTLDRWNVGNQADRDFIQQGKDKRSDFGDLEDETVYYNALECTMLEELMENFRAACEQVGYVPTKWQGPGNLASAMLKAHGIPRRDEIPCMAIEDFRLFAQAAYYGGRFEITASGPVPGPVYQYDINSAYVGLLRNLPCLLHGEWHYITSRPKRGVLYCANIHFNHEPGRLLCNLPVRRQDGTIYYPKEASGVYWSCELETAEAAGTQIEFIQGWVYQSACDCRWFDFVDHLYAERLRLGKSGKGMVLKLAGNSVYGKLAQSIGYAPYANPVWAGLITAGCRAKLVGAYSQRHLRSLEHRPGAATLMLATDGIFTTVPLNLPIGRELGEWDLTEHPDGMFIVQPGLYYIGEDSKTRGVEKVRIERLRGEFEDSFHEYVSSGGLNYTVPVEVDNFITARQALARNNWAAAGTWSKDTREISFNWHIKRDDRFMWHEPYASGETVMRSDPHDGGASVESVAYSRSIGGNLNLSAEERYTSNGPVIDPDQPDWVILPFPDRD